MRLRNSSVSVWMIAGAVLLGSALPASAQKKPKPLPEFRLDGPYLLQANQRSAELTLGDFNSDGLPDIATVANDKSILELFLRESAKEPKYKRQDVVLDQFVRGLAALDIDGDGRIDLIAAGSPARLSWMRQTEDGVLSTPQALDFEADDLVAADVTGDKAPDLVLTRDRRIDVIPYGKKGGLDWKAAKTYWSAFDVPGAPLVLDLNSDGLADLVFTESQRNDRIHVRFQTPQGMFPVETTVSTSGLSDLDALSRSDKRPSLVALLSKTNSIEQLAWTEKKKADNGEAAVPTSQAFGQIRTLAFDPETKGDRPVAALAPLAGGSVPCILVASPTFPTVRLVRATRDGSLDVETVPSLTGIGQVIPVAPQKRGEPWSVALVSRAEKTIAFGRIEREGKTLTFPQPMQVEGTPFAAALAPLGKAKALDLAVCRTQGTEGLAIEVYFDLDPATGKSAERKSFALAGSEGDRPAGLLAADLNGDEKTDLVALFDYADPAILLQTKDAAWEPLALTEGMLKGLLSGVRAGSVTVAPLGPKGEPGLLIAKDNYARAVRLGAEGRVVVDGQFNGKNQRSRVRAAILARTEKKAPPQVVLLDIANHVLSIYNMPAKDEEAKHVRDVDIDDADYQVLMADDLNEDEREDIVLLAPDRLTVVYSGLPEGHLETIGKAATEVEDGAYGLVSAIRALEGDGEQIAVVERTENTLELYMDEAQDGQLRRLYRFKVFDSDSMRGRGEAGMYGEAQPREIRAADLNGDGKPDLVLLMHDKIGVYFRK